MNRLDDTIGFEIVKAKIYQLTDADYIFAQPTLLELCVNPLPDKLFATELKALFAKLMAKIAAEEGVANFKTPDDEDVLKDHLPAHITNLISHLSETIYTETFFGASATVAEAERLFCAHSILKLMEWITWNYEQRCLYGNKFDETALNIAKSTVISLSLFGNKEEVWLSLIEYLTGTKDGIGLSQPVFGCNCYAGMYCIKIETTQTTPGKAGFMWSQIGIIVCEPRVDIVRVEAGFLPFGSALPESMSQKKFLNALQDELFNNFGNAEE